MRHRLLSSLGPATLSLALAFLGASQLGCVDAPTSFENVVRKGATIQGGTVDQADTNVVGIIICEEGQLTALCSGSLIAPNLVLTAQHCVNTPPATLTCGATFTPTQGQSYLVTTSYDAAEQLWTSSSGACPARDQSTWWGVSTVDVPGNDICDDDLAALTLTSPIDGVCPLMPLVDQAPISSETYRAVGFGITSPGGTVAGERYQVSGMAVQCVGSSECHNTGSGTTEWVGSSSSPQGTCEGDSGGPALDAQNRVMGSVSRGPSGACNQTVYESYYGQATWIKSMATQAAQAGGYAPAGWVTGGATSNPANGYCASSSAPSTASDAASEGSRAFLYPNQQHFVNGDGAGNLRHHWWDASSQSITTNTWGTGTAGQPVAFIDGTSQHVFARGANGSLAHWFWDPVNGAGSDNWAPSAGLVGDPAAIMIGDYQDVWAVDKAGALQHWYWGPTSNGVQHDTWGSGAAGRPSVFVTSTGEQHVFARGTGGTLEHWWWTSSAGISHDTWGSGLAGDPTALTIGEFQDVWAVDTTGNLQQWYWGPSSNGVQHGTWGSGVVGRPSVYVYTNGDQEVFVRGTGGTLEHFWWDAQLGISHDTWGTGITGDPTAEVINAQQHVWALDAAGHAQHWFWDPSTRVISHDDWGG